MGFVHAHSLHPPSLIHKVLDAWHPPPCPSPIRLTDGAGALGSQLALVALHRRPPMAILAWALCNWWVCTSPHPPMLSQFWNSLSSVLLRPYVLCRRDSDDLSPAQG